MECNWEQIKNFKIEGDKLYVDDQYYADLVSLDEETGVFHAILISENKFLNGQKVTGVILTTANKVLK